MATSSDPVFQALVSRLQSEGGEVITSGRLVALIRDTTGKTQYRSYVRRLMWRGYLQTLRGVGQNAYRILNSKSSETRQEEVAELSVVPVTVSSPDIQEIREAAELLCIAVEAFLQRNPENGLREMVAIPNSELKVLAKIVADAADYAKGFASHLNHWASIADRLRINFGFTMTDNDDESDR